jgi:tetratricopeptide (TPR) repeat protein
VPQAAATLDPADDAAIAAELAAGVAHHKAGRLGDAELHYHRVLAVRPDHAEANNLLGLVNLALGDSFGAAERLEKAVALVPDNPQFLCNAGVALDAITQHERAVQRLGRAIELKPDYAEAHSNLGMVLKRMHRPAEAAVHYRKAIELRPSEAGFHLNLGHALSNLGELHEAEKEYRRALELRPGHAPTLTALATLLEELDRSGEAAATAEQALETAPRTKDPAYHRSRGFAYRLAGKLEMAQESFRKAIALNPTDIESWEGLSRTQRYSRYDSELESLVRLREEAHLDSEDRISLDLVLGRWFDDIGDDARSFEYFRRANTAIRSTIDYSEAREETDFEIIRRHFDPVPVTLPPVPSGEPSAIFIVGEPRSGKTTLEGMLARHPRLKAAGELRIVQLLGRDLSAKHGLSSLGSHISRVPERDLRQLGKAYLDFVHQIVPPGLVPIDTMPPNFRYIGILRMALPGARVIHTVRDPIEHAIALYQKRFPRKGYPYSYVLDELGAHRLLLDRLMSWWHKAFPSFVCEIDVSTLGDESRMRELLAFCGLEWEPACLGFHQSEPRLGDDPAQAARRREERRRFYEPLLRPHLAGRASSGARA